MSTPEPPKTELPKAELPRAELLTAAVTVRDNAHAPYSGFKVGAAIQTADGWIFAGANVENAAFPQSQCAEASALGLMVSSGEREISAVAIAAEGNELVTPCGGCRQRLSEFAEAKTPIHLVLNNQLVRTVTLGELLPLSFGASTIGRR